MSVYAVVAAGVSWRLPRAFTRPRSGSIVTPAGISVYQTRENDWPGRSDAGSAVKLTIRAGMSLAFPYAEPSKPAGTAPGAVGVCGALDCGGACARVTTATSTARMTEL